MKYFIIIPLVSVFIFTGAGAVYPQFQGADSRELCCFIALFPIIYPIERFQRWYGNRIVTCRVGGNTIRFRRRSVHAHHEDSSRIGFGELLENTDLFVGDRKVAFKRYTFVNFHLNGAIQKAELLEETYFNIMGKPVKIAPGSISFFDDGSFECGTLGENVVFVINGVKKQFDAGSLPICITKRAAGPGR